jgi:hypothetical protein
MAERSEVATSRVLVGLVWLNLAASVLHFSDNMRHFELYPEPTWISNPRIVDLLWIVITPLLVAGWWLYSKRHKRIGRAALVAYGALGSTVLGHYFYAGASSMSFRMHALISLEATAAVALVAWVVWDWAVSGSRSDRASAI